MSLKKFVEEIPLPLELASTSDRACAIVAATMLDALLEKLLRKRLAGDKHDILFSSYGPLSTFAAKIDIALAVGVISLTEYSDLQRVRKIRNEFAHSLELISFSESPIKEHVAQINYSTLKITGKFNSHRDEFQSCIAILSGFLKGKVENIDAIALSKDMYEHLIEWKDKNE